MEKPNEHYRRLRTAPTMVRILIGLLLIVGGIFGILPILGFWMIPLGIAVLLSDVRAVRRATSRLRLWWRKRRGRADASRE